MSSQTAARVFTAFVALVVVFQLALALGAPWGRLAMGGAFPGVYPPAMRIAALLQGALLVAIALVVLSRAGLTMPAWRRSSRWLIWAVTGLLALGVVLNLITPSPMERLIWTPVSAVLFLSSLRVALSR